MKWFTVKTFFLTVATAMFLFSSCKKASVDAPAPQPTIEGTWVGKYGIGNNTPNKYFSFIINKDGTMKVKSDDPNKEYNGTGTWKIEGETFIATYQYSGILGKWNVAAKLNLAAGTMDGSYGTGDTIPDDGTYFMNKQ